MSRYLTDKEAADRGFDLFGIIEDGQLGIFGPRMCDDTFPTLAYAAAAAVERLTESWSDQVEVVSVRYSIEGGGEFHAHEERVLVSMTGYFDEEEDDDDASE